MNRSLFSAALTAAIVFATPSVSQQPPPLAQQPAPENKGIIIGGETPPLLLQERCVDVQIGNDRSIGCLNQRLRREVDRVNPTINTPPIDAKSQDIRVGVVNIPGVQQQYGQNFGRSVIPFRPPAPVYSSQIGPRR